MDAYSFDSCQLCSYVSYSPPIEDAVGDRVVPDFPIADELIRPRRMTYCSLSTVTFSAHRIACCARQGGQT